jgi:hypothetical protein
MGRVSMHEPTPEKFGARQRRKKDDLLLLRWFPLRLEEQWYLAKTTRQHRHPLPIAIRVEYKGFLHSHSSGERTWF